MTAFIVGLLGAESTGKSDLADALARRARALGLSCAVVEEHLRDWCEQRARTPRPHEQAGIAREQTRRIAAQAAGGPALVLADTTALMTAVYSDWLFGDPGLYPEALQAHRACDLTLVTGLDLPWTPDGIQRDGPHVRAPVDRRLRERLHEAGIPYAVVYGDGEARIDAAWRVLAGAWRRSGRAWPQDGEAAAPPAGPGDGADPRLRPWCRECLVPECEHRLFRGIAR